MKGISIDQAEVIKIDTIRNVNTKYGPRRVRDITIKDETAEMLFVLWNDDVERLRIGNIINISGARITFNTWNNQLQINLGYVDGSFQVAFNSKIELDEWTKKIKEELERERILEKEKLGRERILEKEKLETERRLEYELRVKNTIEKADLLGIDTKGKDIELIEKQVFRKQIEESLQKVRLVCKDAKIGPKNQKIWIK